MTYFDTLRIIPFEPTFDWMNTIDEVADKINQPHEDYPQRVEATAIQLLKVLQFFKATKDKLIYEIPPISNLILKTIHSKIFKDLKSAGNWRNNNVTVGLHGPPKWENLDKLMEQLELLYEDKEITLDVLKEWYIDFETIHPFEDGNGRVGGVIVAAYSHILHPEKGWLGPNQ